MTSRLQKWIQLGHVSVVANFWLSSHNFGEVAVIQNFNISKIKESFVWAAMLDEIYDPLGENQQYRKSFSRIKSSIIWISATNYLLLRSAMSSVACAFSTVSRSVGNYLWNFFFLKNSNRVASPWTTPPPILEWQLSKAVFSQRSTQSLPPCRTPVPMWLKDLAKKAWPKKLTEYLLIPKVYVCSRMKDDLLLQHKE